MTTILATYFVGSVASIYVLNGIEEKTSFVKKSLIALTWPIISASYITRIFERE